MREILKPLRGIGAELLSRLLQDIEFKKWHEAINRASKLWPYKLTNIQTVFHGDSGYEDINFNIVSLPGVTTPTPTTYNGGVIRYAGWSKTGSASVDVGIEIPHSAKLVSDITLHFHLLYPTALTGNVKFDFTYTLAKGVSTEPAETTISVTVASPNEAGANRVISFPAISITNTQVGYQIEGRFSRDNTVASNYDDTVLSKTIGFHVEIDSVGSGQVMFK